MLHCPLKILEWPHLEKEKKNEICIHEFVYISWEMFVMSGTTVCLLEGRKSLDHRYM